MFGKRDSTTWEHSEVTTNQLTQSEDNTLENDIITFSLLKAKEKLTQRLKGGGGQAKEEKKKRELLYTA